MPKLSKNNTLRQANWFRQHVMNPALSLCVALLLCGCSSMQIYNDNQRNAQYECRKLPDTAYQECMQEHSQSYEDYKREREELLDL